MLLPTASGSACPESSPLRYLGVVKSILGASRLLSSGIMKIAFAFAYKRRWHTDMRVDLHCIGRVREARQRCIYHLCLYFERSQSLIFCTFFATLSLRYQSHAWRTHHPWRMRPMSCIGCRTLKGKTQPGRSCLPAPRTERRDLRLRAMRCGSAVEKMC
jgi:hypothetical protein